MFVYSLNKKNLFHMQGPATPEKFEHPIRSRSTKLEQFSTLRVCSDLVFYMHCHAFYLYAILVPITFCSGIAPDHMALQMMKRMTGFLKSILGNHTSQLNGETFSTLLILLWLQTNTAIALPLQKTLPAIKHFQVHLLARSNL